MTKPTSKMTKKTNNQATKDTDAATTDVTITDVTITDEDVDDVLADIAGKKPLFDRVETLHGDEGLLRLATCVGERILAAFMKPIPEGRIWKLRGVDEQIQIEWPPEEFRLKRKIELLREQGLLIDESAINCEFRYALDEELRMQGPVIIKRQHCPGFVAEGVYKDGDLCVIQYSFTENIIFSLFRTNPNLAMCKKDPFLTYQEAIKRCENSNAAKDNSILRGVYAEFENGGEIAHAYIWTEKGKTDANAWTQNGVEGLAIFSEQSEKTAEGSRKPKKSKKPEKEGFDGFEGFEKFGASESFKEKLARLRYEHILEYGSLGMIESDNSYHSFRSELQPRKKGQSFQSLEDEQLSLIEQRFLKRFQQVEAARHSAELAFQNRFEKYKRRHEGTLVARAGYATSKEIRRK